MSLTPEQKQTCCKFMEWGYRTPFGIQYHNFDLNDAGLCVNTMESENKFWDFWGVACRISGGQMDVVIWLMTMENGEAVNFFAAMAEWIGEEGK